MKFGDKSDAAVTTIAGLLSHVSGKVPAPGDKIDLEGHKFEVLEANQRKVLRGAECASKWLAAVSKGDSVLKRVELALTCLLKEDKSRSLRLARDRNDNLLVFCDVKHKFVSCCSGLRIRCTLEKVR